MAKKKSCVRCEVDADSWREPKFETLRGIGTFCDGCMKCKERDKKLPVAWLTHRGYKGEKPLCAKCHKKLLKNIKAIKRIEEKSKERMVELLTRKDMRLAEYVRLERVGGNSLVTHFIEFGQFKEKMWGDTKHMIFGQGTFLQKTTKAGTKIIDKKTVASRLIRLTAEDFRHETAYYAERLITRPIDLLRRLGYRVTVRRRRGKNEKPNYYEAMPWAQEYEERKTEIIEEGLSQRAKNRLEKLKEQSREIKRELETLGDFITDDVPEALDPEAIIMGAVGAK